MIVKIIIALAVLAGVGGGAWYWSDQKASPTGQEEAVETSSVSAALNTEGTATFGELATRTGSSECTVSTTHAAVTSNGIVYVAGGNVRVDFSAKTAGMTVSGHVIQTGGYAYTWTDLMPQGVKVKVDDAPAAAASQGFDASTQVEYSCKDWVTDASKFEVPSTVTFSEFNAEGGASGEIPR